MTMCAWLSDATRLSRRSAALCAGLVALTLSILAALSFNELADFHPLAAFSMFADKGLFELFVYAVTQFLMPIGGLLTAVFLQQSYSDALPDTGYMVLMDKIYLLAYIIISMVLLQVIRAGNRFEKKFPVAGIIRLERRLAAVFMGIFWLGILLLCL